MAKCTKCGLSSETNSFVEGDVLKCKCGAVICNIQSTIKKDTILEKLMGKPLYVSIFMTFVIIISYQIVYYDRKYDFFLWRTDTILGGMEKLNFLGNENFISIGQYIMGTLIYSSSILWISFFILMGIILIEKVVINIKERN